MSNRSKSTEIAMIVVLCAFATILAVLIRDLPQIIKPVSAPATFPSASTAITLTPQSITATFAPSLPTEMPKLSLTSTETLAPTTTLASEIRDTQGIKMRLVSAGEFTMGSNAADALIECQKYTQNCQRDWFFPEEPPHSINLSAFYMDVYEVTNARYQACVIAGACTAPHETSSYTRSSYYGNGLYDNYPVIYIDWNQAKTYCEWRKARLPGEAEWEKAARDTDSRTYPWGEGLDNTFANYRGSDTTEVGTYEKDKSPYGIYDMSGNVLEWIADWFTAYPGNTSSNADYGTDYRVLRGGSWADDPYVMRVSNRNWAPATNWSWGIGFRCARDAEP